MAAPARLKTNGKPSLDPARGPLDVDVHTERGTLVTPGERVGAWDPAADAAIKRETRLQRGDTKAVTATRKRLKLTQQALALRAEGWDIRDIAAHFAVAPATITGWFSSHRREVAPEQIDVLLDQIAVPLATENLIHGLIAGDKDYTLETLKGRGQLKRHAEGDGKPNLELPELRIVFESGASPSADSLIAGGRILGNVAVPRAIEGQVVASTPLPAEVPHATATATATAGVGAVHVPRAAPPAAEAGRGGHVPESGPGGHGSGHASPLAPGAGFPEDE